MHEPDEQRNRPEETWDEWFDRTHRARFGPRWRIVLAGVSAAIVSVYWIGVARGR